MCRHCYRPGTNIAGPPVWDDDREPHMRDVPHWSGEAAIYSPELLARREGNSRGTEPHNWRYHTQNG